MTKAIYIMARDPGWFVPNFSAALENRSVVIERLLALRKEIRARKRALEGEPEDQNLKPKWRKALFWWEKDEEGKPGPEDQDQPRQENDEK